MKYKLFFLIVLITVSQIEASSSLMVENTKNYPVTLIVQLYFNQHEIFSYNWPLCNQIWDSYGIEQNTYKKGTYQPIKNVCFQTIIAAQQKTSYDALNLPTNLPHGLTLYIWDSQEKPLGRLFIRKHVELGSNLKYPNDFFPQ